MPQSSSFNGDIRTQATLDSIRKSIDGLQRTLYLGTKAGTLTTKEQQLIIASITSALKLVEVSQTMLDDDCDSEDEMIDDLVDFLDEDYEDEKQSDSN